MLSGSYFGDLSVEKRASRIELNSNENTFLTGAVPREVHEASRTMVVVEEVLVVGRTEAKISSCQLLGGIPPLLAFNWRTNKQ